MIWECYQFLFFSFGYELKAYSSKSFIVPFDSEIFRHNMHSHRIWCIHLMNFINDFQQKKTKTRIFFLKKETEQLFVVVLFVILDIFSIQLDFALFFFPFFLSFFNICINIWSYNINLHRITTLAQAHTLLHMKRYLAIVSINDSISIKRIR